MVKPRLSWFYYSLALLALSCEISHAETLKSATYLSPEFITTPGLVANKFFYDIDFPRDHIGIKSFEAEVVDENGVSVPLNEAYVHHWLVNKYYQRAGVEKPTKSDIKVARNSGVCQDQVLGQYFARGSDTRKTVTQLPDNYAIEVGGWDQLPAMYYEKWLLNVHVIDTRGVVDPMGCMECRCKLYNVTKDASGQPLPPGYEGGGRCCYDQTQCKLLDGFSKSQRKLYLRYTVKWVDWNESVLPVKIYVLDVTDTMQGTSHNCKVEYDIEHCQSSSSECIDSKRTDIIMPKRGYVVFVVALQYRGGTGAALSKKAGQEICTSIPIYGEEPGDEAGYVVKMTSCYPKPGSVEILDGDTLVLESNYSSTQKHTGVPGIFLVLVADQLPGQKPVLKV